MLSSLGSNIRKVRMQRELTQEGVAGMIGMNRNSYVNIENGHNRGIRLSTLKKIADALEVRISYLLDFDDRQLTRPETQSQWELKEFLKDTIKEEFKNLGLQLRKG